MAYDFKLPDIGEGVVEGEVVRWLVKEGDELRQDQPMVEVMTDKATVEIPAPRAGRVVKRMFAEGQVCPVGKVLISIDDGSADAAVAVAPAPVATRPMPATTQTTTGVLATPATRKLARELTVDLGNVRGTGPGGRITSDDVRGSQGGAKARPVASAAGDVRIPFRGLRKKIAEHMVESKREAAHFTYVEEVDFTQLVGLRARANERLKDQGLKLSYLPYIIKATVEALKKFPQLNALLDTASGEIVQRREYHVGVASQTEDGLVVPVIRNADKRSIIDLAREIDRLAGVTKSGKASREDLTGSTFTISSLGALGGLLATPIINFPEVAILAIHKIAKRPVAVEDKIVVRDMMNLSISVDHRLVDGYDAARFIADVKDSLESPGLLFLEAI